MIRSTHNLSNSYLARGQQRAIQRQADFHCGLALNFITSVLSSSRQEYNMIDIGTGKSDTGLEKLDIEFDRDAEGGILTCHAELDSQSDVFKSAIPEPEEWEWLSETPVIQGRVKRLSEPQILIVDEDQETCAFLMHLLNDFGYHVDVAREGEEALDFVKQHPYRLVILELRLPEMDGIELFDHIRQLRSRNELQVVIMDALADTEIRHLALQRELGGILSKPVNPVELIRFVQNYTDEPVLA